MYAGRGTKIFASCVIAEITPNLSKTSENQSHRKPKSILK